MRTIRNCICVRRRPYIWWMRYSFVFNTFKRPWGMLDMNIVLQGSILVRFGGVPMSIEDAYLTLLSEDLTVEEYNVFAHLTRLGYILGPFTDPYWNQSSRCVARICCCTVVLIYSQTQCHWLRAENQVGWSKCFQKETKNVEGKNFFVEWGYSAWKAFKSRKTKLLQLYW